MFGYVCAVAFEGEGEAGKSDPEGRVFKLLKKPLPNSPKGLQRGGWDLKRRGNKVDGNAFADTDGHSLVRSTGSADVSHAVRGHQEPFQDAEREFISLTIERVLAALDAGDAVRAGDLLRVLLRLVA
jgi:hypothetical protein